MFRSALWHVLMVLWLGGLVSGVWWIWPHIEKMTLTSDLVTGVLWIVMGALAWIVAFNYGRQRYWRQR